ncbi:hypothetical protein GY12_24805 [Micrococcus luteus]|nr:hypothetical protein GY12_24805 [Micrococcus luteus]
MASCAASVLFCTITSVGRWRRSTSHAVVADLPVPVAPIRTTSFSPRLHALGELGDGLRLVTGGW